MRKLGGRGWRAHFSNRMWLLLGLLALLPIMAWLQYRWIGQVSDAAGQRAKARLDSSVDQMITEFDGEITRAHLAFRQMPSEQEEPATRFAERYQEWNRLAPYPQLIRDIHFIDTNEEPWLLSRIDAAGSIVAEKEWPSSFASVRQRLEAMGRGGPPQGLRRGGAFDELTVDGNPVFLVPLREPREPGRGPGDEQRRRRRGFARPVGWAVVSFDAEYIRREFLPELTKRLFTQGGESDYELLVVKAGDPEAIVFQSDPAPSSGLFTSPDATAGLFAMRPGCFQPMGPPGVQGPFPRGRRSSGILTDKPAACGAAAQALNAADGAWKLLVKHRGGSLAAAVATFRLRNLAISFGVLLVLALGVTMLTISAERARVLAKLQMEFAMGISHELRTPLTVIRVAADNLANGMMENTRHAQKYGRVIGAEARRLTDMVEQILTFARTQSPGASELAPVSPEQIVRRALSGCGPALREAGLVVECAIEPGLGEIRVDANLIVDCLQNLIHNAVKYAASGGWVRVRAEAVTNVEGRRVRIGVEDRGPGIAAEDLPHIFDPFYRAEAMRNSQIPGVGLGLSLVKRIVEAHHGTVEVESSAECGADSGSTFFLYLPAQPAQAQIRADDEASAIKEVAS